MPSCVEHVGVALDRSRLRLVDLEALGQQQPLRFEAFPLQSMLHDLVEHALVQGVLIDDDEPVFGLLDDVAVVDLQVSAALGLGDGPAESGLSIAVLR